MRGQNFFGVTTTLWVLFAFTTFLHLASAAPQQLSGNGLFRRTDEAAGLGVEVEMGMIVIKGKEDLTVEQREKIKGAEMIPIGYATGAKTNWDLTAEIGPLQVFPEAIVDGLKNKVGEHKTKSIGEEIFKFFKEWAPCRGKDCKVTIKGFDDLGPWSVIWPKDEPVDLSKSPFSPQVTTAMPLQAVLEILSDTKNNKHNPLASKGALYGPKIQILTKDDFKSFKKIKAKDIDPEFLGFFSLLTTYCVLAEASDPKEGPKRIAPVMPRTDFVAQYRKFIEPKLKDQLSPKYPCSKLAKEKFKWTPEVRTPIDKDWIGKAEDLKTGTLEVEKFLDYLQGYDKATKKTLTQMDLVSLMDKTMRHGQIGNLGNKMEKVVGGSESVPVFEFRELDTVLGSNLETAMGSYEEKVIEYHKQPAKRSIGVRGDADTLQEE
ncbi:MAG: hypothetical protein M1820_001711 [Bogoriella megaspora]|nr:MAG: hypothetical protein M1820_001711 [Bogoriella megaspora]